MSKTERLDRAHSDFRANPSAANWAAMVSAMADYQEYVNRMIEIDEEKRKV